MCGTIAALVLGSGLALSGWQMDAVKQGTHITILPILKDFFLYMLETPHLDRTMCGVRRDSQHGTVFGEN